MKMLSVLQQERQWRPELEEDGNRANQRNSSIQEWLGIPGQVKPLLTNEEDRDLVYSQQNISP